MDCKTSSPQWNKAKENYFSTKNLLKKAKLDVESQRLMRSDSRLIDLTGGGV